MRISTSFQYEALSFDIQTSQAKLFQAQQQATTGLAINVPSDNPGGTQQLLQMNGMQSMLNQYQSNLDQANNTLGETNNALTSLSSVLTSAYQIGLQGANASIDSSTQQSLVQQVNNLQQELVSIGNTQGPSGEYLFAGQATNQQPFSASNGVITYSGDTNNIQVSGGPSVTDAVTVNTPGSPLFTNAYNALQSLKNDLQTGNISTISNADIASIQSSMTALQQAQGQVGASVDSVTRMKTTNTTRISDLTTQISSVANVDTATALTNYTQAQTAYQAALQMISQANNLSLSNYISSSTSA